MSHFGRALVATLAVFMVAGIGGVSTRSYQAKPIWARR